MIEFRVLGPVQMVVGSRVLPLGGAKQRGLLALLLLERNRVVPRDRLVDSLWRRRTTCVGGEQHPGVRVEAAQAARRRRPGAGRPSS